MRLAHPESSSVESYRDILYLFHISFAGILDEKAAATQALGLYAKATLELFGPHVERTLGVLQRMASYFHDDVREQAYDALAYLLAATAKAFPSLAPGKLFPFAAAITMQLRQKGSLQKEQEYINWTAGLVYSKMATLLSLGAVYCQSNRIGDSVLVPKCWCLTHMDCMQAR